MSDNELISVNVLFFAGAKDLTGVESNILKISSNSSINRILEAIIEKYQSIQKIRNSVIIAVNQEYHSEEEIITLKEGDEIAVIPPISGGNLLNIDNQEYLTTFLF